MRGSLKKTYKINAEHVWYIAVADRELQAARQGSNTWPNLILYMLFYPKLPIQFGLYDEKLYICTPIFFIMVELYNVDKSWSKFRRSRNVCKFQ